MKKEVKRKRKKEKRRNKKESRNKKDEKRKNIKRRKKKKRTNNKQEEEERSFLKINFMSLSHLLSFVLSRVDFGSVSTTGASPSFPLHISSYL